MERVGRIRAKLYERGKDFFSSPGVHAWGSGTNDLCNLLQEVFLVLALAGHLVEDEEKAP